MSHASPAAEDRRRVRSAEPAEALGHLVRAVARRSFVCAVAVVDDAGNVLAGAGRHEDLDDLKRVAGPAARGDRGPAFWESTRGTDLLTRPVRVGERGAERTVYLAALGARVRRMPDAARAVARILDGPGRTAL